ncbi:hypothetical protein RB601_003576 [Gaeumannomyces tritici]
MGSSRPIVCRFSPQEVLGREPARASRRLHTLPVTHPVTFRLRHSMDTPSRLSRLYTSTVPERFRNLDPISPGATEVADLFGLQDRPPKASRPKGDPGPRLEQADPGVWWEANRPTSFANAPCDPKHTWEKDIHGRGACEKVTHDPALVEGKGQLHTLLAEESGYGNFESYHLWSYQCLRAEKDTRPPRRKEPLLAQNGTEEAKWWRRGRNVMIRIRIEKAFKSLGTDQIMHISKDGVEGKGQATREEDPEDPEDSDAEKELPIVEVGRLE